ncbi:MAG: purine-nucleoside phosphorylase [Chloroflexi bacterium]|nr:purine-nucleoside phosphorylase [Chloroflexota bacterium]
MAPERRAYFERAQYEASASALRSRTRHRQQVGLILGSGLGALAERVGEADIIPYGEIPYWPTSTVEGHAGRLIVGGLEGHVVAVMQGRVHYYEGCSMAQITLPVRVMRLLGVETLIVTNAAGGVNPEFRAGDLMLIVDHLNLMGMAGNSPLRGPNDEAFGPRFPDMSQAYDPGLRQLAVETAGAEGIQLRQGVYAGLAGPSFETSADIRFLRLIGVDAVGMSTVPEVTVARHASMRVLGLSGISNALSPHAASETTHEEVLEAGRVLVPKLIAIVRGVLRRMRPAGSK